MALQNIKLNLEIHQLEKPNQPEIIYQFLIQPIWNWNHFPLSNSNSQSPNQKMETAKKLTIFSQSFHV